MVVVGVIVGGCGSKIPNIPMTRDAANAIPNRKMTIARRETPDFRAITPGRKKAALYTGIFAPAGVAKAILTIPGNKLVEKNDIDDPARYIGEQLSHAFAAKYGITISSGSISRFDGLSSADLVLDVETTGWGFTVFRDSDKYQVYYHGRLRFVDAKGGSLIAGGTCASDPEETPSSPTYVELVANGAERLKKELRDAAEFCIGEFTTKVFQW